MRKSEMLRLRLEPDEKQAFDEAARYSGLALSAWVRERLRRSARIELTEAGREVRFGKMRGSE